MVFACGAPFNLLQRISHETKRINSRNENWEAPLNMIGEQDGGNQQDDGAPSLKREILPDNKR